MSKPDTPKFRVAIIGAGIGGLLLALFLQKDAKDVAVDIYESTAELAEVGAGIGFWPRMWEMLTYLGLEDDLVRIAGSRDGGALPVHYRKGDEPKTVEFYELPPVLRVFHRAELQKLLASRLTSTHKIHFGKRFTKYDAAADSGGDGHGPITLHFTDGTLAEYDLLVGADGVRSAVRRAMYDALANDADRSGNAEEAHRLRAMREPVWSREISYRGLVPARKLRELGFEDVDAFVNFFGKNKHILWYPICQGTVINIAAFVSLLGPEHGTQYDGPWVSAISADDAARDFEGWDPNVQTLLKTMEDPLQWSIHECHSLPTYVRDRVVLIGDAAHAMRPHQGAGAGQAMEDGLILAAILAEPSVNLDNVIRALKVYDTVRRPAAQEVQRLSEANGMLYQLRGLGWEKVTVGQSHAGGIPLERLVSVGKQVEDQMAWMIKESVMEKRDMAVAMVKQELAASDNAAWRRYKSWRCLGTREVSTGKSSKLPISRPQAGDARVPLMRGGPRTLSRQL